MKKVSLRVRNFDKERFLTFNIDNDASLDEELLDFIEDEEPVGIVPVIFEEGEEFDTFSYDITDKIHLSELSNQEINAEMVLKVLHSLIVSLVDMAEYRVPLSYLVLHRDYIYVDSDYKIEFICIPVEEMQEDVDINSFLRAFLASLRYELSENCNYVAKLLTYVNNGAVFNLRNMVTLVEELMDDMGIEIPDEDSTEIYADYQEVMDEAEELENEDEEEELTEEGESDSDEADEEEPLEEETSSEEEDADEESHVEEETEVDDDQETETDEDDISADDEDDAETSEDEIEENSESVENEEDEQEEPEKEEEPVVSKSSKKSAFTLRKPEPDEEEEEEDETPLQEDLKEEDEEEDESVEVEEFDGVINDEEENLSEDEGEVSEEDFDTEGDDDTYEANEEEVLEEPVEEEKTSKKTLFKTKEATVTGVVIEDELDEFLAEKEREDQLAHFEDNGLKIKKNIKVNRASIVKNTQEELKAEEEEAKAEEEENVDEEEEEEVENTSILSQALGGTGILKGVAVPKVNPYLIRTNTKERVMITKQNFKIGKASMGVDYTVKGNGAVSRTHAIITNKDGSYYIKDNKSTNHTYVNNKLVEDGENELLTHDCKIVLGDEEFTFKLR